MTTLPFDLVSDVISDLETRGKVTVKIDRGLRWIVLKKVESKTRPLES